MGLDMYLSRKFYVKNWDFTETKDKFSIIITQGKKPSTLKKLINSWFFDITKSTIPIDKITTITTEEMYWRKSNAIHKWFVTNVQDGNDDCNEYFVPKEQLRELLSLIDRVVKDHSLAPELLPTSEGFFFGDNSYDDYYFSDLEYTHKTLSVLLLDYYTKPNDIKDGEFYYQSSW
tara:strand:+ start:7285 stop:7809 length:525 start_codon:yes stop_codon:yes gene_type:complete